MADNGTNDVPVFKDGDVFRLVLHVTDPDGVSKVEARFRNDSDRQVASIYRSVDLGGETDAVAEIEFGSGEDLAPGHYVCEYVALTDRLGNESLVATPGIEFRIEGDAEENRGPALLDWSFA
jgi:hypothetical protein